MVSAEMGVVKIPLHISCLALGLGLAESLFVSSLTSWSTSFNAPCFGAVSKRHRRVGQLSIRETSAELGAILNSAQDSVVERNGSLCFGHHEFLQDIPPGFIFNSTDPRALFLDIEVEKQHSNLDLSIGKLKCDRFLACVRQKLWWMVPTWGSRAGDISCEAQFLLLRLKPNDQNSSATPAPAAYAVILPLVSGAFRASLHRSSRNNDQDTLHLRLS
eukprot:CAMPEP_0172195826 /NCGR_PEP_ID=MMETSP1050-20130122/26443_1 /TAXON_ID=233186 /ORGANISM="Cryptomonas curvata, Strain CCAP979/52" /LENGTH=216 /DNA_ID=CAMNT_0012871971 /DNA_START=1 /DNA_END=647 /DNA_ORIENTATION=-